MSPQISNPSNIKYSIHSALVNETIQCQFGRCGTTGSSAALNTDIGEIAEIHVEEKNNLVGAFIRTGSCFEWGSPWQETALWIYPDATSTEVNTGYDFFIDQIELIPDDFPEDETINVSCETEITLGGKIFCQPSGTKVKYTWTDESFNVVVMYQVTSNDAGEQTVLDMNNNELSGVPTISFPISSNTSRTLTRIFTIDGGLDLDDCNDNTYKVTIITDGDNTFGCSSCDTNNTIPTGYKLGDAIAAGILDNLPAASAQTVCIEGTLEIDFDYNFVNSQLNMLPGSRIVVKDGAYLTLSNSRLSGCTAMWAGIEIEKGGGLKMSNTTISDAQYGINLEPATTSVETAPEAEIISSTFCDNFIGIYASATGNGKVNVFIANNTFANSGDLLPPYSGQSSASGVPNQNTRSLAGLYLNNLNAFLSRDNDFFGLTSGIVALNTNMVVNEGIFTEMTENLSYYPGYAYGGRAIHGGANGAHLLEVQGTMILDCVEGIFAQRSPLIATKNTLKNVNWGIFANLSSPGGNIIIGGMDETDKNSIEANRIGIMVNNAGSTGQVLVGHNEVTVDAAAAGGTGIGFIFHNAPAQVVANTILVKQSGVGLFLQATKNVSVTDNNEITMEDESLARAGVTLQGATNCLLSSTLVTGDGTGGTDNYGIEIFSSPGNKYCCNDLNKTRVGVLADGGSLAENHFSGTIFGNHYYGLLLPSSGILGTQVHQKNQWTGVYGSGSGAVYQVASSQAQEYPFIYDASENSYHEAPNSLPTGWFIPNEDQTNTDVCAPENCVIDEIKQDSPDTKRIAGDSIQAGYYTSTVQWELNRYLYAKLEGVTITEQGIQDFVVHHDTTTVGAFHNVDQALANMFEADSTEVDQIMENLDSIRALLQVVANLDTALLNASGTTYQTLWQSRTEKIDDLFDYDKGNINLLSTLVSTRGSEAASIWSQNDGIVVDSVYEQNTKTVNGIYTDYLLKGLVTPDTASLNALQAVANQCPLSGGNAVYQARALLKLTTSIYPSYDDQQNCLGSQPYSIPNIPGTNITTTDWQIYPNPATNEVTIDLSNLTFDKGRLQIYDLNGKDLWNQVITTQNVNTQVNISDFQAGIYLVILRLDERQPETKKLVILQR